MKFRTTGGDLYCSHQQSVNETIMETYRVDSLPICAQVLLIRDIVHHVRKPSAEVGVIETAILEFQLEARVNTQEQSVFPSYNNRDGEYTTNNSIEGHSYNSDSGKSLVFLPGWGQAGHATAMRPSGVSPPMEESCTAPPRLRRWRWVQRRRTRDISL